MANSSVFLSDLQSSRFSSTVEVRLLHFWEARNVRRGGNLMGIDMLLLDSQLRSSEGSYSKLSSTIASLSFNVSHLLTPPEISTIKGLVINDTGITSSASFLRGYAKVEPLTIAELCQFIITTEPQAHLRPLIANVWCYISCSKCAKKLQRSASLFACIFCNQTNFVGVLRYCLEMTVADDSDEAVFVKFLCEITKLTNIWAADAGHLLDYDR
ncbi:hypothetical protein N665_0179s0007 [Sinapis alba]|nr:hypothetical protein N665_0179s0007 [Sinapis alba]